MLSIRDPFISQTTNRLKIKGWKNVFHANNNQKGAGVAILISSKTDFKAKIVTRDKEGQYLIIKGSNTQEYITIINISSPQN